MVKWMVEDNFGGTKPVLDWGYCYGLRMDSFRNEVNQIEKIVRKLKTNPESKSATISLMDPQLDFDNHMPCIMSLDFKIRKDALSVVGFFRSQDIGKKFYADILSLGSIQKQVAQELSIQRGQIKIFISSAHIYEQDFDKVSSLIDSV